MTPIHYLVLIKFQVLVSSNCTFLHKRVHTLQAASFVHRKFENVVRQLANPVRWSGVAEVVEADELLDKLVAVELVPFPFPPWKLIDTGQKERIVKCIWARERERKDEREREREMSPTLCLIWQFGRISPSIFSVLNISVMPLPWYGDL